MIKDHNQRWLWRRWWSLRNPAFGCICALALTLNPGPHGTESVSPRARQAAPVAQAVPPATPPGPRLDATPEQIGDSLMAHQRYQAAIREQYKKASPHSSDVWNKMGVAYQLMFNLDDAARCYEARRVKAGFEECDRTEQPGNHLCQPEAVFEGGKGIPQGAQDRFPFGAGAQKPGDGAAWQSTDTRKAGRNDQGSP